MTTQFLSVVKASRLVAHRYTQDGSTSNDPNFHAWIKGIATEVCDDPGSTQVKGWETATDYQRPFLVERVAELAAERIQANERIQERIQATKAAAKAAAEYRDSQPWGSLCIHEDDLAQQTYEALAPLLTQDSDPAHWLSEYSSGDDLSGSHYYTVYQKVGRRWQQVARVTHDPAYGSGVSAHRETATKTKSEMGYTQPLFA